jgi:5-methyltetrahydropteroyltriglutamate--homocysteine methyltransferase
VGEELRYAAELINAIVDGVTGPRIGLHICRGNWSTKEEVLLTGDYKPLLPALTAMRVHQFVLEYATPRAGDIEVVGRTLSGPVPGMTRPRELGLGVVNPRTTEVESVEYIMAKAEAALKFYQPKQLFLNTDCGFGCFANRCVNVEDVAAAKIKNIAEAAKRLREKYA